MKCFLISILYFTVFPYFLSICKALDVYQYIDAKAYSMGNTLSVLPGFANPASCSFTTVRSASLQYVNRYGVKELSTYAGLINLPNKYLNTGYICLVSDSMHITKQWLVSMCIKNCLLT